MDEPMFRCQLCGEEYVADTHEEYQGIPSMGGLVTFLDDDGSPCCDAEGKPIKGAEGSFSFEEDEYSPDEVEGWVVFASDGEEWTALSHPLTYEEAEKTANSCAARRVRVTFVDHDQDGNLDEANKIY